MKTIDKFTYKVMKWSIRIQSEIQFGQYSCHSRDDGLDIAEVSKTVNVYGMY